MGSRELHIRLYRAVRRAFTLIELLVVIVILGILLAVALPTFLRQQNKAKDSEAQQYLTTAYKVAKGETVGNNGAYPAVASLVSALSQSEPELTFASGAACSASTGPKNLIVLTSSTSSSVTICNKSNSGHLWQVAFTTTGSTAAPTFTDLGIPAAFVGYDAAVMADSPSTFWRLNETGSPATVADSSGNGYTGTATAPFTAGDASSNPTSSVAGNTHFVFPFSGSGNVRATGSQYACAVSGCTVELWFLPSASQTNNSFITTSPLMGGYGIYAQYDGASQTLTYYVNHGGGGTGFSATVAPGSWVLLDLVYKPSTHYLYAYINGSYNSSVSDTEADWTTPGLQTRYAEVDDVAFYPTSLSAAQISAHYAAR